MAGQIHDDEHPFAPPADERSRVRQLRGRLAAPVTVVTAGEGDDATGITVSSLVVAEGEPARVYFLAGPATDAYAAIERSGRFVVHILDAGHRDLGDVFAGLRPSPGGVFSGAEVEQTEWGPVLVDLPNRAYCTYTSGVEESWSIVVSGTIDRIEVDDLEDPLVYFRGRYRSLG